MYHKKLLTLFTILTLVCTFGLTGCTLNHFSSHEPLSRTQFVLGTTVTISLYTEQSEQILTEAFAKLTELENLLSVNKADTLIDQINENAGIKPVAVDTDTFALIKSGIHYSKLTDGAFDISVGPLTKLWHIGFPDEKIPTDSEIQSTLPLINYEHIILDEALHTVFLEQTGMALDLGGIAKGYATDCLVSFLEEKGVQHAIISLGGNVFTLGSKPDNTPWNVGIQDPFNPRGDTIGIYKASNASLVTSGIYERYIEDPTGKRYHHILDPKTGYPYDNGLAGVTIISPHSIDGDALSTAAFALGLEDGLAFIETLQDIEAIFITTDRKVYTTKGAYNYFTLTGTEFTLSR